MADQFAIHSSDDYAEAFANLLPQGPAWPRERDTVLQGFIAALAEIWGTPPSRPGSAEPQISVDGRAGDLLLREADPRSTIELLPEWERAWGLPDPCLDEPVTIEARQNTLVSRITMLGGQSPAFFVKTAAAIGYAIKIIEHSPFMAGISRAGDTRPSDPNAASVNFRWEVSGLLGPNIRFYWRVLVLNPRLSWFRAGSGRAGLDPMLTIGRFTDLECLLTRLAPAHASISFDYSGVVVGGALAGTP